MLWTLLLGSLAALSIGLVLWQFVAGWWVPLHRVPPAKGPLPPVTLLKPIKGCDEETRSCLESWLRQDYPAPLQLLFGVPGPHDPAVPLIQSLLAQYPDADARLVYCPRRLGPNRKVSKLMQLLPEAAHGTLVISDADVWVPAGFLRRFLGPLEHPATGLVHAFYRQATRSTPALRWEAVGVNADFWTQVLQAHQLGMRDFALGAVIGTTRDRLEQCGGLVALLDVLADDFELGQRMVRAGFRLELVPLVVECREQKARWATVWRHQMRWARTIQHCRPVAYALSLLNNALLWPLAYGLWGGPGGWWIPLVPERLQSAGHYPPHLFVSSGAVVLAAALGIRLLTALILQARLTRCWDHLAWWWMVPVKDALQVCLWVASWLGTTVEWRGESFRLLRSGRFESMEKAHADEEALVAGPSGQGRRGPHDQGEPSTAVPRTPTREKGGGSHLAPTPNPTR